MYKRQILLLVPALISLMMMLSFRASYNESITHMETVSNLKPMVETLIPEQLWALVAGQADIGQCGVYPVSYTHLDVYKRQVQMPTRSYFLAYSEH